MIPAHSYSRRRFLGSAAATTAVASAFNHLGSASAQQEPAATPDIGRKIKIGLIGCGGRGSWIAGLFQKHGGYTVHAVGDYFPEKAEKTGKALGIPEKLRFSGLSAYQKVIGSGVEAVIVINIPHFHPMHTHAAIDAGLHVYGAKPVAVDTAGSLAIQAAGKLATKKKLVHFVDFQIPTDPVNQEVAKRIQAGSLGKLSHIDSMGFCPGWKDPANRSPENLLKTGNWMTATELSGDCVMEYSIHTVDAVIWAIGKRPVKASATSRYIRPEIHGKMREIYLVTYEFDDGLAWTHRNQALNNVQDSIIRAEIYGDKAHAQINYWGKSFLRGPGGTSGNIDNLYHQGAVRNIATFYQDITSGNTANPTVTRAVDDSLTCVLGREAGILKGELTMDQLIKDKQKLDFDTTGLKT